MNWKSNGFLGAYADYLNEGQPPKPEDKLEALKQLRIQRYEERQAKAKACQRPQPPPEKG
jgi:hypothetical protein